MIFAANNNHILAQCGSNCMSMSCHTNHVHAFTWKPQDATYRRLQYSTHGIHDNLKKKTTGHFLSEPGLRRHAAGHMEFFWNFQQNLPSISSILNPVTSAMGDLADVMGDATYAVSDQLTEKIMIIKSKVQLSQQEEVATVQVSKPGADDHQPRSQAMTNTTRPLGVYANCDCLQTSGKTVMGYSEIPEKGTLKIGDAIQASHLAEQTQEEEVSFHMLKDKYKKNRIDSQGHVTLDQATLKKSQDSRILGPVVKEKDLSPTMRDNDAEMEVVGRRAIPCDNRLGPPLPYNKRPSSEKNETSSKVNSTVHGHPVRENMPKCIRKNREESHKVDSGSLTVIGEMVCPSSRLSMSSSYQ